MTTDQILRTLNNMKCREHKKNAVVRYVKGRLDVRGCCEKFITEVVLAGNNLIIDQSFSGKGNSEII